MINNTCAEVSAELWYSTVETAGCVVPAISYTRVDLVQVILALPPGQVTAPVVESVEVTPAPTLLRHTPLHTTRIKPSLTLVDEGLELVIVIIVVNIIIVDNVSISMLQVLVLDHSPGWQHLQLVSDDGGGLSAQLTRVESSIVSSEVPDHQHEHLPLLLVQHPHPPVLGHHLSVHCQQSVWSPALGDLPPHQRVISLVTNNTGYQGSVSHSLRQYLK